MPVDPRHRRSDSYEDDDKSSFGGHDYTLVVNTRVRIYTLLTVGTIICYIYYGYMSSGFRGYQYNTGGTFSERPQEPIEDAPLSTSASVATTIAEPDATSVVSTALTAAPTLDASTYWLANMKHQGVAPYNADSQYKVFRDVTEFGAKGDGKTDDTEAINAAISAGARCGENCDSSTITPALVYFPPGRYLLTGPIVALYHTQLVGNPLDMPELVALNDFKGIAVIDTNPYGAFGKNWYTNQNNFFRAIRNFVIDLTNMDPAEGTGIHHQVAQATSIHNVVFKMNDSPNTKHRGIFMDNGSGGFLSGLKFYGGEVGAYFGNQQFTTINLEFHNCKTAIYVNWDWVWLLKSIKIYNSNIGIDITSGAPDKLGVGSVLLLDSYIENTPIAIKTSRHPDSKPPAGGTLVLQNLKISGVKVAVSGWQDREIFGGNEEGRTTTIPFWGHGKGYSNAIPHGEDINVVADETIDAIPSILKDSEGKILERPRPLYRHIPHHRFVSVRDHGAVGDGKTDDTAAIQQILSVNGNTQPEHEKKIIFFDYGVYRVTSTIYVPPNTYIVGEMWSVIMSSGSTFGDVKNPKPVFKVGNPGEEGIVQISDMLFQTQGPAAGAILMEWNVSDHDLDDAPNHDQMSLYTGRGLLCESEQGPVWMYGHAVEHNVLYNYQLVNTKNIFMGVIQTETPYFQSNPRAREPFPPVPKYHDPDFEAACGAADTDPEKIKQCEKSWGLRILNSTDVFTFGAGLYSFFDNWSTESRSCQHTMVKIEGEATSGKFLDRRNIWLMGLNTIGTENIASWLNQSEREELISVRADDGNTNGYADTVGLILV
ncbi:hypothetical protein AA313_de0204894 [Arthrobotrys entomopaga]|nr:hypothetical protein AA313_de0204894 [Arthrobotrys entomopaga]